MLNIDLKSLGGMESHRGIGYMMLLTSIFAPSFLAVAFLRPELIGSNLLAGVLIAASVGLMATAGTIASIFLGVSEPQAATSQMKKIGARSLGFGSALSLLVQAVVLGGSQVAPAVVPTFKAYVLGVGILVVVQAFGIFAGNYQEARKRQAKAEKASDEAAR